MTTEAPPPGNSPLSLLKKVFIPAVLVLGIAVGALFLVRSQLPDDQEQGQSEAAQVQIKVGATLPDVTLDRFPEGEVKLSALGKKLYVINFWASWCEACISEMPSLVKLQATFGPQGLEVLGINLDDEPAAVVPKAIQDLKINFSVFKDPESELADLFHVHAIPLTVILDSNRKILHIEDGDRDWMDQEMQAKLMEWLK